MQRVSAYIQDILGYQPTLEPVLKDRLGKLPLFITATYNFYELLLLNRTLILAEIKDEENLSILNIAKQFEQIRQALNENVVLLSGEITAFNRKRLIERGVNFIIPGKQLFLPDMLIDLRETYSTQKVRVKEQKLLPSAQFILLYYILHRYEKIKIDQYPLHKLAEKFKYTKMAISNAVDDLKYHELCTVRGSREKFIHFEYNESELWYTAEKLLSSPVLKRVYVDEKPERFLYHSNTYALSEYSDMNRSRQEFYAIEKDRFYYLQKNGQLKNLNDQEGQVCLEVWKYDPDILATEVTEESNVDPLSLYLSLKESHDERIEMALEKIIEKFIW